MSHTSWVFRVNTVWLNGWALVYVLGGCGFESRFCLTSDMAPAWAKSSSTISQTIKCGFTLKLVRDMIITYSQMHRTGKYSQHRLIIWPVWLNGWVFVYEESGYGLEYRCCHLWGFYFNLKPFHLFIFLSLLLLIHQVTQTKKIF